MPRISVIAKNYAKALFDASNKSNSVDKINKELDIFRKNFSIDFARELKNPVISKNDAKKIIEGIATKLQLGKIVSDFLVVVARNKRLNLFPEIYEEFVHLNKLQKNILDVELIATDELSAEEIDNVKKIVGKKYSGKTIEIKQTVDRKILGGLQIKIGSDLIDASLKNQLASIAKELVRTAK